jgi:hypothetical protein
MRRSVYWTSCYATRICLYRQASYQAGFSQSRLADQNNCVIPFLQNQNISSIISFIRNGYASPHRGVCHAVECHSPGPPLFHAGVILEPNSFVPLYAVLVTPGREKSLPVLFPTPHSFFIEFEKRFFYSSRVSLQFVDSPFSCLSPLLICSSFVPWE